MSKYDSKVGRPDFVTDDHLKFLDELRESGVLGSVPYIQEYFPDLTEEESLTMLSYWMKTFGKGRR